MNKASLKSKYKLKKIIKFLHLQYLQTPLGCDHIDFSNLLYTFCTVFYIISDDTNNQLKTQIYTHSWCYVISFILYKPNFLSMVR